MANWSGILASLSAVIRPSIVEPRLVVSSISQLDFIKFKQRGVVGVVIDKDNCITVPHQDELAKGLREPWQDLLDTFGQDNVLIVSNSVGTFAKDPALLGAESVSRNLKVPVLCHSQPKPGFKCVEQIVTHFNQLSSSSSSSSPNVSSQIVYSPLAARSNTTTTRTLTIGQEGGDTIKLLVIGDRLATDLILSTRLSQSSLPPLPSSSTSTTSILSRLIPFRSQRHQTMVPPNKRRRRIETVGILTTGLHEREGLGTTLLRGLEKLLLKRLERKKRRKNSIIYDDEREGGREKWEECLKNYQPPPLTTLTQSSSSSSLPPTTPTTTTATLNSSTRTLTTSSSSRHHSITPRFLSFTSTFLSLPKTIPHFLLHQLPRTLTTIPSRTFSFLKKSIDRSGHYVLETLFSPRLIEILYKPLRKFTQVYKRPQELVYGGGGGGFERSRSEKTIRDTAAASGEGGGKIDKIIDKIEEIVKQARETVKRKEQSSG
ncbi:hypothetical protein JCM5350_003968 [Sporobolomyces pararoseus]